MCDGHVLAAHELEVAAMFSDNGKDFLITSGNPETPIVNAHLTFSKESDARWPMTTTFGSLDSWISQMKRDHVISGIRDIKRLQLNGIQRDVRAFLDMFEMAMSDLDTETWKRLGHIAYDADLSSLKRFIDPQGNVSTDLMGEWYDMAVVNDFNRFLDTNIVEIMAYNYPKTWADIEAAEPWRAHEARHET
jgi:hypothetical protein